MTTFTSEVDARGGVASSPLPWSTASSSSSSSSSVESVEQASFIRNKRHGQEQRNRLAKVYHRYDFTCAPPENHNEDDDNEHDDDDNNDCQQSSPQTTQPKTTRANHPMPKKKQPFNAQPETKEEECHETFCQNSRRHHHRHPETAYCLRKTSSSPATLSPSRWVAPTTLLRRAATPSPTPRPPLTLYWDVTVRLCEGTCRHSSAMLQFAAPVLHAHLQPVPAPAATNTATAWYRLDCSHRSRAEWHALEPLLQPHSRQPAAVTRDNLPLLLQWFVELQLPVLLQTSDVVIARQVDQLLPMEKDTVTPPSRWRDLLVATRIAAHCYPHLPQTHARVCQAWTTLLQPTTTLSGLESMVQDSGVLQGLCEWLRYDAAGRKQVWPCLLRHLPPDLIRTYDHDDELPQHPLATLHESTSTVDESDQKERDWLTNPLFPYLLRLGMQASLDKVVTNQAVVVSRASSTSLASLQYSVREEDELLDASPVGCGTLNKPGVMSGKETTTTTMSAAETTANTTGLPSSRTLPFTSCPSLGSTLSSCWTEWYDVWVWWWNAAPACRTTRSNELVSPTPSSRVSSKTSPARSVPTAPNDSVPVVPTTLEASEADDDPVTQRERSEWFLSLWRHLQKGSVLPRTMIVASPTTNDGEDGSVDDDDDVGRPDESPEAETGTQENVTNAGVEDTCVATSYSDAMSVVSPNMVMSTTNTSKCTADTTRGIRTSSGGTASNSYCCSKSAVSYNVGTSSPDGTSNRYTGSSSTRRSSSPDNNIHSQSPSINSSCGFRPQSPSSNSSCSFCNDRPRRPPPSRCTQSATLSPLPKYKLAPPPLSPDETSDTDCTDDFVDDDPTGTDLDSSMEEDGLHYKDYHHFKDETVRVGPRKFLC